MKSIRAKAYWWQGVPNFGDALAPLLLERFADLKVEWDTISRAKIASVGSILEHVPPLWDGVILGSGKLMESSRLYLQSKGSVTPTILALRGPLTARGIPGNYMLGDPGILTDELVGPQEKQWDLGVIPHFSDLDLVPRFKALIPKKHSVRVIHPSQDPLTVVREIGACHRVVTSSLHGMIVADAFGIPRRVEYSSKLDKDGGDFKFRDYSASIRMKFEPGKMAEPSRLRVEDLKFAAYDAYRELARMAKSW
jgi:pyruvyltransferase